MNKKIAEKIKDKIILITGGTGSFGNTIIKKLLELNPARIIIFSRDEEKQFNMRNSYDNPHLRFIIGDVRDKNSVQKTMDGVDYVFHAAALKQVPTCEFFPIEAVKTNIFGTHNILSAAAYHKVERVVVLSTDKAVYPVNTMGMTKALMEKIMIAESNNCTLTEDSKTVFCAVRYGNVLYTRGSVLPYFIDLIKQGKELRVTNPKMTRFLLPLREAVDLALFAITNGENGCIYVRKSPACTIETLARAICKIFNYNKNYTEVGIRAGEKIHETLVSREEFTRAVEFGDYYKIPPESRGFNYNEYLIKGDKKIEVNKIRAFTSENTMRLGLRETINLLLSVPEIQGELEQYEKFYAPSVSDA